MLENVAHVEPARERRQQVVKGVQLFDVVTRQFGVDHHERLMLSDSAHTRGQHIGGFVSTTGIRRCSSGIGPAKGVDPFSGIANRKKGVRPLFCAARLWFAELNRFGNRFPVEPRCHRAQERSRALIAANPDSPSNGHEARHGLRTRAALTVSSVWARQGMASLVINLTWPA